MFRVIWGAGVRRNDLEPWGVQDMLGFVLMASKADCDAETGSVEEETGTGEGKGFSRST